MIRHIYAYITKMKFKGGGVQVGNFQKNNSQVSFLFLRGEQVDLLISQYHPYMENEQVTLQCDGS